MGVLQHSDRSGDGEISEIDVTFSRVPEGTRISIIHSGFQKSESLENHRSGWGSYVTGFIEFLASST